MQEDDDLYKFQLKEWDPIIQWFCDKFQVDIQKSRDIGGPVVPEATKASISRYLMSHNFAAINGKRNCCDFLNQNKMVTCVNFVTGFVYGVDTLKSVILTLAAVERFIPTEKAVLLSRLEEEFQVCISPTF